MPRTTKQFCGAVSGGWRNVRQNAASDLGQTAVQPRSAGTVTAKQLCLSPLSPNVKHELRLEADALQDWTTILIAGSIGMHCGAFHVATFGAVEIAQRHVQRAAVVPHD